VDALAAAVAEQRVDTVRVCFPDHYGVLRGRRLAAESFLDDVSAPQAFCDGALVWDIRCDIFESTDFSNFRTGYPDLYARPDLDTLRPCGWRDGEYAVLADAHDAHGHPIEVDPRRVLRRVVERLPAVADVAARLELRVPDTATAASWAPGHAPPFADALTRALPASGLPLLAVEWSRPQRILGLTLAPAPPLETADALAQTRTAAREIALAHGVRLTAMPRLDTADRMTAMGLDVDLPEGNAPSAAARRLEDVALLLRPLPTAYGPEPAPLARTVGTRWSALASSDACPYLAVAAALAAGHEQDGAGADVPVSGYPRAVGALREADWTRGWFHAAFIHDALALAEREATLRAGAVTTWDLERYWEAG
jgi:glutamine synthetase